MSTSTSSSLTRSRSADLLALLGLVSGVVSSTWGQAFTLTELQPVALVFGLDPGALPIGVFYGIAMGLGVALWARKPWVAIVVLVITIYAWSAAVHTAFRLQRTTDEDVYLIAASLCAGAVGAGITHLGCAIFAPELRRPSRLILTCLVGAAAGMLYFLGMRKYLDERLLYVVWQPVVAYVIGLGMRPRAPSVQS